jgi:peptidyl-prolyl cis-trans isomerase SurA
MPNTLKRLKDILMTFQVEGNLPDELRDLQTIDITEVKEDGLMKEILKEVKTAEEGTFTNPITIGEHLHVFYIKKKDLVESELFLKEKDQIKGKLFERYSVQLATSWFERETAKHFIKIFL